MAGTGGKGRGAKGNGDMDDHCELRSGPIAGSLIVAGATFARKALTYAEVDGMAVFEGDIVLGPIDAVRRAVAQGDQGPTLMSVGIIEGVGRQFRWPNATIPYEIDAGLPNQQRVTDAIAHWEASTRIRFVLRTAGNAAQHPDFVRFVPGGGCSSQIGRRGGQQIITLGAGCTLGNTIHEIGHTVGLWHEQSREDRDTFVEIVWANIDPAMQHNFTQHIADGDDLGAYDYGSIMHYPPTAFSINGQATIVARQTVPPGVIMGQRNGLSAGDIAGVHLMYPKTPLDDLTTVKEMVKDPITEPVQTWKELVKDPIFEPTPTFKEVAKDPILDTRKEVIADPTIKEGVFDPGPFPGPGPIINPGRPFVLGTAHQVPGLADHQAAVVALAQRAQQLAAAMAALDIGRAVLAAEHDQIQAQLQAAGGAVGV